MKILMVNKFLYPNGGSETYLFGLGEYFQKQGHEVQYFGMDHEKRIVRNALNLYTTNMDFHSGKIQKLLYPFRIIYSLDARKKIRKILNHFRPDAVHLNNINFQITPAVIDEIDSYRKKNKCKLTIIYTAHDYQWICPNHMLKIPETGELCMKCTGGRVFECYKNKCIHNSKIKSLLGSIEALTYKIMKTYAKVDKIICPSYFMKEQLDKSGILSDKTVVMHNFIEKSGIFNDVERKYILYMGRYSEEKGIKTLLKVCEEIQQVSFVFAGSGPLEEDVNSVDNVINKGFLTGEELISTIQGAKALIYPSEWYENCPLSVMEAIANGTPVITSDLGGLPELVEEGITGKIFHYGNEFDMKEKILELWNEDENHSSLYHNCKHNKFQTVDEYGLKLLELYKTC